MKYYIEIDGRDIGRFRIDKPCQGSHGNCVLVLKDKYNMTVGFELLTVGFELLSQRPRVEWIPCSERLPEEIGDYLVTEKISDIAQAVYTSSFGHIRTGELCFYYEDDECIAIKNDGIVAWMPLPEPYKKECDPK